MSKVELNGELFVLVEENDEDLIICAEIDGFNIWDWLNHRDRKRVRVVLETIEDDSQEQERKVGSATLDSTELTPGTNSKQEVQSEPTAEKQIEHELKKGLFPQDGGQHD